MEIQMTAEQIVKLIERKRDINEHLMGQTYDRNDWQGFGAHVQRRDALQELLNEVIENNGYIKQYPGALDYLETPFRHPDGVETHDWVIQGRPQY